MLLPRSERQPLCEPCCSETSDASSLLTNDFLPHDVARPKILGVAATLSPCAKIGFVATNIPYFAVAAVIFLMHPITRASGTFCCTVLCASSFFHGSVIGALGALSTYWHGAQCQMQPSCCRWLYCYSETTGSSRLHSVTWLKRLVLADIGCSAFVTGIGVVCFGPGRTFSWLALPIVTFVAGSVSKARGRYALYAVFHGIWHMLSAVAIGCIVLEGGVPFDWTHPASEIES